MNSILNVSEIWDWCQDAYHSQGYNLRLPKCSDVTKTYQWRYILALSKQFEQWSFDKTTSQRFLREAASYANERKLLHKGLSVLVQNNLLQEVYTRLNTKDGRASDIVTMIRSNHAFVRANGGLLKRSDPDDYRNIVRWYLSKKVSVQYLAISKACYAAMKYLSIHDTHERGMLPTAHTLLIVKMRLANAGLNSKLKDVLYDDWKQ